MKYVVGVDSGGSKTRALAVDLEGNPVGYAESAGGNPSHNPNYKEALGGAISEAVRSVGVENVVCVVSGIAGFDKPSDAKWAEEATAEEGLNAERIHVNDAEVAHFGAFSGSHGVVSIQGHGSNVFAITEDGTRVLNADFLHYASGGAVVIGMRFHFALLSGGCRSNEEALIERLCDHWNVHSLHELWELGRRGWDMTWSEAGNRMGAFAPVVTSAALDGSVLALHVCRQAAYSVSEGIGLVGQCFRDPIVPVVLIGSSVRSEIMRTLVGKFLEDSSVKHYEIREPESSPLVGAVLMALRRLDVDLASVDRGRLERFVQQRDINGSGTIQS